MTQDEKLIALGKWYIEAGEKNNGWKVRRNDREMRESTIGPNSKDNLSHFIINEPKPEKKIIDLSVCIKSGIDIEFYNPYGPWWSVAKLDEISTGEYLNENYAASQCRLRENHWYAHDKSEIQPIPEGFLIEVTYINDTNFLDGVSIDTVETDRYQLYFDFWSRVLKYRIIKKLPEYKYEWEE